MLERGIAPGETQAVALEVQPGTPGRVAVVVEAGEQLGGSQREGIGVAAFAHGDIELGDVAVDQEAQRAAVALDLAAPGDRLQAEQRLAQVGVGEVGLLFGPEQGGELGPADPGALQRQVGEQLAAALERQGGRRAVGDERGCAEELQSQRHRSVRVNAAGCAKPAGPQALRGELRGEMRPQGGEERSCNAVLFKVRPVRSLAPLHDIPETHHEDQDASSHRRHPVQQHPSRHGRLTRAPGLPRPPDGRCRVCSAAFDLGHRGGRLLRQPTTHFT